MLFLGAIHLSRGPCLLARSRTDADAFAAFYQAYADRVFRSIVRQVLDAELARDLASETFAVALERRLQFRGQSAEEERAWLFAIAGNQVKRYWRDGKVEREALARMSIELPELTDAGLEQLERKAGLQAVVTQLSEALDDLPADQRDAVTRRVIQEQSYRDIAERQGVSQQLVRARVSRGLRTLAGGLNLRGVFIEDVA